MQTVRALENANRKEIELNISEGASWHAEYKNSAYVFVGGLDYSFTEGDVINVFSQFGEIVDCNLVRDKDTGRSRGFAFVAYEDQRSTVLAVDNFNGSRLKGRVLRCDHVKKYRKPKTDNNARDSDSEAEEGQSDEEYERRREAIWNPRLYEWSESESDSEDGGHVNVNGATPKPKKAKATRSTSDDARRFGIRVCTSGVSPRVTVRTVDMSMLMVKEASSRNIALKFSIDCEGTVQDEIFDVAGFEKFLHDRMEINGKAAQRIQAPAGAALVMPSASGRSSKGKEAPSEDTRRMTEFEKIRERRRLKRAQQRRAAAEGGDVGGILPITMGSINDEEGGKSLGIAKRPEFKGKDKDRDRDRDPPSRKRKGRDSDRDMKKRGVAGDDDDEDDFDRFELELAEKKRRKKEAKAEKKRKKAERREKKKRKKEKKEKKKRGKPEKGKEDLDRESDDGAMDTRARSLSLSPMRDDDEPPARDSPARSKDSRRDDGKERARGTESSKHEEQSKVAKDRASVSRSPPPPVALRSDDGRDRGRARERRQRGSPSRSPPPPDLLRHRPPPRDRGSRSPPPPSILRDRRPLRSRSPPGSRGDYRGRDSDRFDRGRNDDRRRDRAENGGDRGDFRDNRRRGNGDHGARRSDRDDRRRVDDGLDRDHVRRNDRRRSRSPRRNDRRRSRSPRR